LKQGNINTDKINVSRIVDIPNMISVYSNKFVSISSDEFIVKLFKD